MKLSILFDDYNRPTEVIDEILVHNEDKDEFQKIADENNIDLSNFKITYIGCYYAI